MLLTGGYESPVPHSTIGVPESEHWADKWAGFRLDGPGRSARYHRSGRVRALQLGESLEVRTACCNEPWQSHSRTSRSNRTNPGRVALVTSC